MAEAQFRQVVFRDICCSLRAPYRVLGDPFEFTNYALGWRIQFTQRERILIRQNDLYDHDALTLDDAVFSINYVGLKGYIPYVCTDRDKLLWVRAYVTTAAAKLTLFFEAMPAPVW